MQYQLPNGNVIYLSTEDYLSLSDEELDQMARSGFGDNPSYSTYSTKSKKEASIKESPLDYTPDSEEIESDQKLNVDDLPNQ